MTIDRAGETFTLRKWPYLAAFILIPFVAASLLMLGLLVGILIGVGPLPAADLPGTLLTAGLLLGITLPMLQIAAVEAVTLDRHAGQATFRRATIYGATQAEISLADVWRAELEAVVDSEKDVVYRVVFRLRNGDLHPFMKTPENWLGDKQSAIDAINQFLGVESPLLPTRG